MHGGKGTFLSLHPEISLHVSFANRVLRGTPLPIWVCDSCGAVEVIGSLRELAEHARQDLQKLDLHRPYVDTVTWTCSQCGSGTARRIPDVADCWFDFGSDADSAMALPIREPGDACRRAPGRLHLRGHRPDTRLVLYAARPLHAALRPPGVQERHSPVGLMLDAKGEKMSKSRRNVADPFLLVDTCGADSARWFMYALAPPYNPRSYSLEYVGEMRRQFLLTLWNVYAFFVTYANVDRGSRPERPHLSMWPSYNRSTRWALARLNVLVRDVTEMLDAYDIYGPARKSNGSFEHLSSGTCAATGAASGSPKAMFLTV